MSSRAREQSGPVTPAPPVPPVAPETETLALRPTHALQQLPRERPLGPSAPTHPPAQGTATRRAAPMVANAQSAVDPPDVPAPVQLQLHPHSLTWVTSGLALLAGFGWLVERRRRRLLEVDKDSVFWANAHHGASSILTTARGLTDILPDSPDPAEAARTIYVTAIGETNSRREATLIDLHQLRGKLMRRRERGDNVAALLLLQQHLVDFRYSSPWVFLELLELYKVLDRPTEWEIARGAFKQRFGQNAPAWGTPSTEHMQLADDAQLAEDLALHWPYREARMFILRWVLGDPAMRMRNSGPPLLGLGVYRDLMLLDSILDDVVVVHTQPTDSLL